MTRRESGMTNYPTDYPQPQPAPQPPPQAPPKKRKTWLIVLIVILVLALLGIAGCVAMIGGLGRAVNESVQKSDERAAPRDVTEGQEFTVGSHKTLTGWKIKKDASLGDPMFTVTGKVTNVSDATSTAFIHFKMINKQGEVLGNVECNSADLEPGQTQALNCIPDGKWGKFTKITVEATF
jgi:hypothetical protein